MIAQEIESERDRRLRPEGRQWATNPDWMAWGVGLMSDAARIARSHATSPVTVDRNVWGVRLEAATIVEEPSGPECGGGANMGVDWIAGKVIHEGDAGWRPWDEGIFGKAES